MKPLLAIISLCAVTLSATASFAVSTTEICGEYLALTKMAQFAPDTQVHTYCQQLVAKEQAKTKLNSAVAVAFKEGVDVELIPLHGGGIKRVTAEMINMDTMNCDIDDSIVYCSVKTSPDMACKVGLDRIDFKMSAQTIPVKITETKGFKASCGSFN